MNLLKKMEWVIPGRGKRRQVSSVAVDNAERDNDGHAKEHANSEHQPSVLELAGDDATKEDRTRSRVVVVIGAAPTSAPATGRTLTATAAAATWYDRSTLDGCDSAVEATDLSRQEQPSHPPRTDYSLSRHIAINWLYAEWPPSGSRKQSFRCCVLIESILAHTHHCT